MYKTGWVNEYLINIEIVEFFFINKTLNTIILILANHVLSFFLTI